MYESELESCIDFITSGIDCGEDPETVEVTLTEIKEFHKKYEFTIQDLPDRAPSSDTETLCSHLSWLKIRKIFSVYWNYKKEPVSAQQSRQTIDIPRLIFDNSRDQTHTDNQSLKTYIFSAPLNTDLTMNHSITMLYPVA